jgi:YVTN family beta-propeller protein
VTVSFDGSKVYFTHVGGVSIALVSLIHASAHAQNAYITNVNSNNVSVIDTVTNTVIATIPVGLKVIDTVTNTVVATIPVGLSSHVVEAWRSRPTAARSMSSTPTLTP